MTQEWSSIQIYWVEEDGAYESVCVSVCVLPVAPSKKEGRKKNDNNKATVSIRCPHFISVHQVNTVLFFGINLLCHLKPTKL